MPDESCPQKVDSVPQSHGLHLAWSPTASFPSPLHYPPDRVLLSATTQQEQLVITDEPMDWFPIYSQQKPCFLMMIIK